MERPIISIDQAIKMENEIKQHYIQKGYNESDAEYQAHFEMEQKYAFTID